MSDRGTSMGDAEWESALTVRRRLAYGSFGLITWGRLTDEQRDEAVRREVKEAGAGETYALECIKTLDDRGGA